MNSEAKIKVLENRVIWQNETIKELQSKVRKAESAPAKCPFDPSSIGQPEMPPTLPNEHGIYYDANQSRKHRIEVQQKIIRDRDRAINKLKASIESQGETIEVLHVRAAAKYKAIKELEARGAKQRGEIMGLYAKIYELEFKSKAPGQPVTEGATINVAFETIKELEATIKRLKATVQAAEARIGLIFSSRSKFVHERDTAYGQIRELQTEVADCCQTIQSKDLEAVVLSSYIKSLEGNNNDLIVANGLLARDVKDLMEKYKGSFLRVQEFARRTESLKTVIRNVIHGLRSNDFFQGGAAARLAESLESAL